MKNIKQRKAFTVVEMVIVIAVIAILATVLIPTISGVIQKANHSTDVQFAASLNIQLALWEVDNGAIESEDDLRNAINEYYGAKDENGELLRDDQGNLTPEADYYSTLSPKSGKYGYHFWYDVENKQVVVAKYDELLPKPDETSPAAEEPNTFSPASPRSLEIGGKAYFLMDQAGDEVVSLVVALENLGDDTKVGAGSNDPAQQYEYIVNKLYENATEGTLEALLLAKVQTTTIVTGQGAYRFSDVDAITHIYVPMYAEIINVQKIFVYTPGVDGAAGSADGGTRPSSTCQLANSENVNKVEIPLGVKIASNGFPAMATGVPEDYSGATVLYIPANNLSELTDAEGNFMFDVQTCEPVFELANGAKYVMLYDEVYSLPYKEGNESVEIGGNVGTGTSENLDVEVFFPDAGTEPGGTHYYDGQNNILYVQYDLPNVAIEVSNGKYVEWSYELVQQDEPKDTDLVTISDATLSINRKVDIGENNQILVTGRVNGVEKVSFTVCLVRPTEIQIGTFNSTTDAEGVIGAKPIELQFEGTQHDFTFDFSVGYSISNKVEGWPVSFRSENGEFTVTKNQDNTVTITLNNGNYDFEDKLIVTIGDGIDAMEFKFVVTCEDNSGAAFENQLFYDANDNNAYDEGDVKIGEKYLFRVGNKNGITLGQLFKTTQAYNDVVLKLYDYSYSGHPVIGGGTQTVTVTGANKVNGATNNDTYWTTTRANWENVSLKFAKNGVVKIEIGSIKNGVFDSDAFVYLEVVDGTNVTDYSQLGTSGNYVLWSDITMTSGKTYSLSNGTLFGNGYTFDVKQGAYAGTTNGYTSEMYVIKLSNAVLDNVEIVGKVYTEFNITGKQDYNRAIILSEGSSGIYNSYISNGATPVRIYTGTLVIDNTTLKGGSFANLDIHGGEITLKDVTTINQVNGNDKADDGTTTPIGLGIAVWYEQVNEATTITVEGTLKQYNYVAKNQTTYLKNDYAKQFVDRMFTDTKLDSYRYDDGTTLWVNTGILSMVDTFDADNLKPSIISGYSKITVSAMSRNGMVCTVVTDATNYNSAPTAWKPTEQEEIAPTYKFDYTSKNKVDKVDGSNDYCYESGGIVYISMDEGDTFNWDPFILTATKLGNTLSYSVSMNGTNYASGTKIPFSAAGKYTITYSYTDSNNYDKDGNTYGKTYTKTVKINVSVVKAAAKNAKFDFGGSGYTTVTIGNDTYIMPTSNTNKITINGTAVNYVLVDCNPSNGKTHNDKTSYWKMCFPVFDGVITISDYADGGTGTAVTYGSSTTSMPSGLTLAGYVNANPTQTVPSGAQSFTAETKASTIFKYRASADADNTPSTQSNKLVFKSPQLSNNARDEDYILVKYQYNDNAGKTYYYIVCYHTPKMTKDDGCFTSDTLITLADGTQKRVDELLPTDTIMAWDFFAGEYTEQKLSFLVNHGEDLYTVTNLEFSDGTTLKVIEEHGVFDYDLNKFVYITAENYTDYIGHNFVKQNLEGGYDIVELLSGFVTEEYTSAWSVTTVATSNAFASGLLTVGPPEDFYNWIEMSDKLQYDAEQFAADVEKYGLYTYEDFADYITYDQFVEWNGAYLKIAVEKGYFTFERILELIDMYQQWMF